MLGIIKFRRRAKIAIGTLFDQTEQYMTAKLSEVVLSDNNTSGSGSGSESSDSELLKDKKQDNSAGASFFGGF